MTKITLLLSSFLLACSSPSASLPEICPPGEVNYNGICYAPTPTPITCVGWDESCNSLPCCPGAGSIYPYGLSCVGNNFGYVCGAVCYNNAECASLNCNLVSGQDYGVCLR